MAATQHKVLKKNATFQCPQAVTTMVTELALVSLWVKDWLLSLLVAVPVSCRIAAIK